MSAAPLLERLQRVHQSAPQRWRAVCPAHESKHRTQSLAIRELGDGTVLLKCFAGCGATDIVDKLGLQLADLFPSQHYVLGEPRRPQKPNHWHAIREAIQTLKHECLVVAICASDIGEGHAVPKGDADRCFECATKIRAAIEACA
jgi:hypothetical protein